ncbi:MAG: cytochrome c biogenesis protein CcsA [Hydrogenophilus sp.]|nr:cytochrome c biogenesis protein CcsA [Hydrogenophilus sp.]
MDPILLHLAVALAYGAIAAAGWRVVRRQSAVGQAPPLLIALYRLLLFLHAIALVTLTFTPTGLRLGVAPVLSLTLWLAGLLLAIDRATGSAVALLLHAPLAAGAAFIVALIPLERAITVAIPAPLFALHLIAALISYALFSVVALEALLMAFAERALHRHRALSWLEALPPLIVMERHLFRLILIAFLALTLTNLTGLLSDPLFGIPWRFDHKTLFSLTAWVIFAILLIGRWRYGWRGTVALQWLWSGLLLLALAYLGFHLVRDLILTLPPSR